MNNKNIKACIFDFDGVIIDSERIHARAKEATLKHFEIKFPPNIFNDFKGQTDKDFFSHVVQHLSEDKISAEAMIECKKSIYATFFEEIQLIQEVDEFILFARERFEILGITTSTTLHDYLLATKKFHIEKFFDFIITGEDTHKHKPDPEPYLLAIQRLSFDKKHAMVIEDSPNGIRAAKAAGLRVFGLTSSFSEEELTNAGADYVVHSFRELKELLLH